MTLEDVARAAGVAPITVSRVISGSHPVREVTRAKVEGAIKQLHYQPNQAARSLAVARSFLIGVLTSPVSAHYYGQLHKGAAGACRERGYHLVLEEVEMQGGAAEWYGSNIHRVRFDGLVVPPPLSDDIAFLQRLEADGIPYVRIAPNVDLKRSASVTSDEAAGAAALADHLWAEGYRRFAIVVGPDQHVATRLRQEGFTRALARHGISREDIAVIDLNWEGSAIVTAQRVALELIPLVSAPVAVFAFNDELAAGLLRVVTERGLKVPRDLAIAGFDGSDICELTTPALTTIRQPIAEMAKNAVMRLTQRDGPQNIQMVLPVELEVRASTLLAGRRAPGAPNR